MNFPLMIDDELQLQLIQPDHAEELFKLVEDNREYLSRWLPFPPLIKSVDDIQAFIEKSNEGWQHKKTMVCLIVFRGQPAGIISFNKILETLGKADIGYWLSANRQGNGIITRACEQLIQFGFNELNLTKIEIRAARDNLPSRAVCERLGGQLEGIITQSENLHGKILDHAIYALHRP